MTYSAIQIADWFIKRAQEDGRQLAIMQLLKLTYIAHGWHLGIYGAPLFSDRVEAWKYGPVIKTVYEEFRPQGVKIAHCSNDKSVDFSVDTSDLLEEIYDVYGAYSSMKMSDITHEENGPWDLARQVGGYYAHITDGLIRSHYEKKRIIAEQRQQERQKASGDSID